MALSAADVRPGHRVSQAAGLGSDWRLAKTAMALHYGGEELTNLGPGRDFAVHVAIGDGAAAATIPSAGRRAGDHNADLTQLRSSPPAALLAT